MSVLYRKLAALIWAGCVLVGFAENAQSQDRYMEIAARYSRATIFHDALVLPDGEAFHAVVTFRIPNSLLVFKQERDGFVADVDVTVELLHNGVKVSDQIWREQHRATSFASTQSRTEDVYGWVRFQAEPGTYAYRLMVNGTAMDDRAVFGSIAVRDYADAVVGPLLFGRLRSDSQRISLEPIALGGNVPFGVDVPAIVPVKGERFGSGSKSGSGGGRRSGEPAASALNAAADDVDSSGAADDGIARADDGVLTYRLYRVGRSGGAVMPRREARRNRDEGLEASTAAVEPIEIGQDDELVASGTVAADALVPLGEFLGSEVDCLCWSPAAEESTYLAVIPLATDRLESGTYVFNVSLPGESTSNKYRFSTQWRDMPLSLYDVAVAIRNLEYIEDRETIRALLRGSDEDRVEAFEAYWRERDPTPDTVYNELMHEYYRRIDHAAFQFRTGQHPFPDGLRTDAARIYIVYGPPDDVSSSLPASGGVEQTWTYTDGRQFTFWAASSLAPLELQERPVP